MASRFAFVAKLNPQGPDDVTITTSGGTITGASGTVEIVFDDTVFSNKTELLNAIQSITDKIKEVATPWPLA